MKKIRETAAPVSLQTLTPGQQNVLAQMGEPDEVRQRIQAHKEARARLAGRTGELAKLYPSQWVAMYRNRLVGHADSLSKLLAVCDEKGFPRGDLAITFLDKEKRRLAL